MSLGQCVEQVRQALANLELLQTGYTQLVALVDQQDEQATVEVDMPLRLFPGMPETADGVVRVKLNHEACVDATGATGRAILQQWQELHAAAAEGLAGITAAVQAYDSHEAAPEGSATPPPG